MFKTQNRKTGINIAIKKILIRILCTKNNCSQCQKIDYSNGIGPSIHLMKPADNLAQSHHLKTPSHYLARTLATIAIDYVMAFNNSGMVQVNKIGSI